MPCWGPLTLSGKATIKVWARAAIISRLSWVKIHFDRTHSSGGRWQAITGLWLEESVACHGNLSMEQLTKQLLASLGARAERERRRSWSATLSSCHSICYMWIARSSLPSKGEYWYLLLFNELVWMGAEEWNCRRGNSRWGAKETEENCGDL